MPMHRDRFAEVIASPSNPGMKMVRSLQRRKYRQQERAFVVEGVRAVTDVLAAGVQPRVVYVREDVDGQILPALDSRVPVRRVITSVFDQLTDTVHPQGVLAVVPMLEEAELPNPNHSPLIMILDGIRDPGNMGTLLRSAAGAGLAHVVIGPECVDPYHPRAVRAAMGSHLRIPFSERSWVDMAPYLAQFVTVGLADAHGDVEYDAVDWTSSAAMIVGSEAFGPSPTAFECANLRVSIPLVNGVESLNAGVAGSLLAFEAARHRRSLKARGNEGA
jgi:RNA methyltransferase, TrmH family